MNITGSSNFYYSAICFYNSGATLSGNINVNVSGHKGRGIHVYTGSNIKTDNAKINIKADGFLSRGIVTAYNNSVLEITNNSIVNILTTGTSNVGLNNYGGNTKIENAKINIITSSCGIQNQKNGSFYANNNGLININSEAYAFYSSNENTSININSGAKIYIKNNSSQSIVNPSSSAFNMSSGAIINIEDTLGNYSFDTVDYQTKENLSATSTSFATQTGSSQNTPLISPDWSAIENEILSPTETPKIKDDIKEYKQFVSILNQYDALINDGSYKGVNLLKNESLSVRFNEDGNSNLNITGKDMSSGNLGVITQNWQTAEDVAQSIAEIASAMKQIRSYNSELGNNYSIITNRQEFTENLINVLTEGADKLTLADMNEESANILALQTRQQLAINSLSLAAQSAQAVLKLF